jgi:transposase
LSYFSYLTSQALGQYSQNSSIFISPTSVWIVTDWKCKSNNYCIQTKFADILEDITLSSGSKRQASLLLLLGLLLDPKMETILSHYTMSHPIHSHTHSYKILQSNGVIISRELVISANVYSPRNIFLLLLCTHYQSLPKKRDWHFDIELKVLFHAGGAQ